VPSVWTIFLLSCWRGNIYICIKIFYH